MRITIRADDLIRNRSGRPKRWRGRRSYVKLFLNFRKGWKGSLRDVCAKIKQEEGVEPNPSRVKEGLDEHVKNGGKGIERYVGEKSGQVIYVRRDGGPTSLFVA
jgi:hypothetical protein